MKSLTKTSLIAACAFGVMAFFANGVKAQNTSKLTDPEIASIAVTANQIDVDYADLALKKTTNNEVKNFAVSMKRDHNAVIQQAVALAQKLNVTPQTNDITKSLLGGQKKTTKMLKSKKGKEFDKAYIDNEVEYHKFAINAVKTLLVPNASNKELKALLESALPLFESHLEHAQMVQKNFK